MRRFFELTFRPFFVFTGVGTALISVCLVARGAHKRSRSSRSSRITRSCSTGASWSA